MSSWGVAFSAPVKAASVAGLVGVPAFCRVRCVASSIVKTLLPVSV